MLRSDETSPAAPAALAALAPSGAFLEEKAFRARTLLLFGTITDASAYQAVRHLLALDAESDAPIAMIVSSPGGHLESGDAIHDALRFISAPVDMIGSGWVGSAATHVFLGVPRERRVCLPQTRFLIHQPSGGAGGPASDIAIQASEILKARARIARVIARETGQPLQRVEADIERDCWMSAQEAMDYGLVSRIVERRSQLAGR